MRQATVTSMGRAAPRRARVRNSLAMKAKVRISGEAETMTLGVGVELAGEREELREGEEGSLPGS
jgi:hypothetical protein